jgi:hypothetical protein
LLTIVPWPSGILVTSKAAIASQLRMIAEHCMISRGKRVRFNGRRLVIADTPSRCAYTKLARLGKHD